MSSSNTLSVYIPRVFPNISGSNIAEVFESLGLGKIERIDMVPFIDEKNRPMFRAFVYIQWADNEDSHLLQYKITNPQQQAKIVYDNPWFWYLLPNKTPMTAAEVETQRRLEYLEFQHTQMTKTIDEQQQHLFNQGKILFDLTKTLESQKNTQDYIDQYSEGGVAREKCIEKLVSKLGPADEEEPPTKEEEEKPPAGHEFLCPSSPCPDCEPEEYEREMEQQHQLPPSPQTRTITLFGGWNVVWRHMTWPNGVEDYEVPDWVSETFNSGKMEIYDAVAILTNFVIQEDESKLPAEMESPTGWNERAGEAAYWALLKVAHELCRENYGYGVQLENPFQQK